MTRGQIATIFTLGVSATVAVASIGAVTVVWFSDTAFAFVATLTSLANTGTAARAYLCAAIGFVGIGAAYYLVSTQQWIAERLADRALSRLRIEFERLEAEYGSEEAAAILSERLRSEEGDPDLFGEASLRASRGAR